MPYVTWVLAQDLQVFWSFILVTKVKTLSLRLEVWDFLLFLFQALGIFMLSSYIPMNKLSSLEEAIDQNLLATFLLVSLFLSIWFLRKSFSVSWISVNSFFFCTGKCIYRSGEHGCRYHICFSTSFPCDINCLCLCFMCYHRNHSFLRFPVKVLVGGYYNIFVNFLLVFYATCL